MPRTRADVTLTRPSPAVAAFAERLSGGGLERAHMRAHHVLDGALGREPSFLQQEPAPTEEATVPRLWLTSTPSFPPRKRRTSEAPALEGRVSDCEHLVEHEDVGLEVRGD